MLVPVPNLRKMPRQANMFKNTRVMNSPGVEIAVAEAHASEGVEELNGRELAPDDVIEQPVGQKLV